MTLLGSADVRREGWRPLAGLADTVTAQWAFVSLEDLPGTDVKDWPLGEAAALDLEALDE